jgi:hypothetical protein
LAGALYYVHICSQYGWELEQKMLKDPKYFTLHPWELRGITRRGIIRTLPDDLSVAKQTHIYAYGALTSPTGESNIQKEANGPLSIGYGSGYTTIGPEYGFGVAMEEKLDAPILIIKCA